MTWQEERIAQLEAEVERLKEALRFYADVKNYTPYENAPMEGRVGRRARAALTDKGDS